MNFFAPSNNNKGIFGPISMIRVFLDQIINGVFLLFLHSLRIFLNQSIDDKDIFKLKYKQRAFLFFLHSLKKFFILLIIKHIFFAS